MRLRLCLILSLSFVACGDSAGDGTVVGTDVTVAPDVATEVGSPEVTPDVDIDPGAFCQGTTTFAWDPNAATFLAAFPDDAMTVDAPETSTGLRVSLGAAPWLEDESATFHPLWRQLEELDGWGTSAGVVLRFDGELGALPSGEAASLADAGLTFWDLGGDEPVRIAFEAERIEGGKGVILWPMRPLRDKMLHAVALTRAHLAADGACVKPSPTLVELARRTSTDSVGNRLMPKADRFFAATGIARADISALALFTTQDVTTVTLAQRDLVNETSYTWKSVPTCTTKASFRECKGTFEALDLRREGYLGDATEPMRYTLPVRIWLPKTQTTAAPVMIFGHGLGGDASQASYLAEFAAGFGMATIALPAPRHGDHPTARHDDPNAFFTDLLGIDLATFTVDAFVFRENVRQAVFDKLQLLQLLKAQPDIDGAAGADLDLERVSYWGISLGGIMGGDFSALSQDVDLTVLSIPGTRVVSIITDATDFSQFKNLLATLAGGDDAVARMAPLVQTLVDAGDPVNWAAHLVRDRFDATPRPPPHVLVQMVIDDGTVPNVATRALVRAIGPTEQVPPIVRAIDPLAATGPAPISANAPGGTTVGVFQFDRMSTRPGGTPQVATHTNVFSGIEAVHQVASFFESWLTGAPPIIIDPYAENGTPPLR